MVPSVAFLSLLGAAALAGVQLAPVEKEDHAEEIVTRCIVEVLLNGLSKANAPPINPQCKELLRKNNQQKQEKENGGKDLEHDMKTVPELEEKKNSPEGTVREEQGLKEEGFKRQAEGDETWHSEGKPHGGTSHLQDIAQGDPWNEAHNKERKKGDDKRTEEDGSSKRNGHDKEESKDKKHSEDERHEGPDEKPVSLIEKGVEGDYKHSGGQRSLEEIVRSQEERDEESKEEEDAEEEEEEEEEEESREKYHHSFHREYEDSSEREEADPEKQGRKPRHYHRKPRLGSSSEYRRHHHDEKKDSPKESSEEEREFWDKRSHYPKHYYETGRHSEEKRNSNEIRDSEEMEGTKQYRDRWQHSREDNEEDDMRHHSNEEEEKQYHYERKRFPDEPEREIRHRNKLREDTVGKPHNYGSRDEKRYQLQLEDMPKPQNIERENEEQTLESLEEGPSEEKRHSDEEELGTRHHSEQEKHLPNKRTLLIEEGYPRSHYLVQNLKRAVAPYLPYYQQLRWKNRHAEKKDDLSNPYLESEEELGSRLSEREFFPEYNDYDLWAKKQLMEGLNHKHHESSPLERSHKFDVKRQYNKMDELAHLLSNRKKSVEFPELYSSKEDVKRGHIIRNSEAKLSQRPLTQDEEKELENLAAMDLELQKIAEKFNSNRRG
ncbi:secretogranin-1 [Pogona vitticeps]